MIHDQPSVLMIKCKVNSSYLRRRCVVPNLDMRRPVIGQPFVIKVAHLRVLLDRVVLERNFKMKLVSHPSIQVRVITIATVIERHGNAGKFHQALGHLVGKWVSTLLPRSRGSISKNDMTYSSVSEVKEDVLRTGYVGRDQLGNGGPGVRFCDVSVGRSGHGSESERQLLNLGFERWHPLRHRLKAIGTLLLVNRKLLPLVDASRDAVSSACNAST